MKNSVTHNNKFSLTYATTQDVNKIINSLKTDKATGPDRNPAKFLELSDNVIDSHSTKIINKDIARSNYFENAKIVNFEPSFKKDKRTNIKNHRLFSLLNIFCKN